jgi:hypothetical protein
MKNNNILTIVIVAVVVGAIGFFGGMQYQKMQRGQFTGAAGFNRTGGTGRFGQNGGSRPVAGDIVSVDASGITVKMRDGSTKIVVVSSSTTINKAATGTKSDLKQGETVAVFGTQNSDGSVTAQTIQLNPMLRAFGGTPTPGK